MDSLDQFYQDLREEVNIEASADPDGCSREEMFTRLALRRLEEAGEAENALECRDRRESISGQTLHKLNGYAFSEGFETLDLYVSLYYDSHDTPTVNAQAIRTAVSQLGRFVSHAARGYADEVEESAPVYELAQTIRRQQGSIVRLNFYVLTNARTVAREIPGPPDALDGVLTRVEIRDLEYLKRLAEAEGGRIPIEVEFPGGLPCLPFSGNHDRYRSYLAIIPGETLADIYEEHGTRLLEQNVRSFLQARVKVNRGIKNTILEEPHMFLAYNNGITATAGSVEIETDGAGRSVIRRVHDLQIVNGGQTTASIFHTRRKFKADLSGIAVQVKLTVIEDPDQFSTIVASISRYANSQNRISEADLTANSPYNVALEQLSRAVWAPAAEGQTSQTRWFFERARGQYRTSLNREGVTPRRKKSYAEQNPAKQKFDKEEIARFTYAATGKPWLVVRGRQKAYADFVRNLKKGELPTRSNFEDLVARAILFRTAESLYGTARQSHNIGDMRYITVPYALSWLSEVLARRGPKLDLYRIWKNQSLSPELSLVVRALLEQMNDIILRGAPGGLYGEWAKKEETWKHIRVMEPDVDLATISRDLESSSRPRPIYGEKEIEDLEGLDQEARIRALPPSVWRRIQEWASPRLPARPGMIDPARTMFQKLKGPSRLTPVERRRGIEMLDLALEEGRHLFDGLDEIVLTEREEANKPSYRFTVDDAAKLFEWERRNVRLKTFEAELIKGMRDGKIAIGSDYNQNRLAKLFEKARRYGYPDTD